MNWGAVTHPVYGHTGYTDNLENGQWYSLDNRRLYAYQEAKRDYIPHQIINDVDIIREEGWKFTTTNFGTSVILK